MSINKYFVISFQPAAGRRLVDADDDAVCDLFDVDMKNVAAASNADDVALAQVCDCDDDVVSGTLLCAYDCDHDLCDDEDLAYCTRCLTYYCGSPVHCLQGLTHLRAMICCFFVEAPDLHILLLDLNKHTQHFIIIYYLLLNLYIVMLSNY